MVIHLAGLSSQKYKSYSLLHYSLGFPGCVYVSLNQLTKLQKNWNVWIEIEKCQISVICGLVLIKPSFQTRKVIFHSPAQFSLHGIFFSANDKNTPLLLFSCLKVQAISAFPEIKSVPSSVTN